MARESKMKVALGIENKELNDGLKQSKAAIKDFDKTSSDAFTAFGRAIGLDTRQISQLTNSVQGLGAKLKTMGGAGTQAFGEILAGCKGLAAGIAGLGIAAATAAFKELNAEAKAFKNTVQGASIELQTSAYVNTYKQFLRDQNQGRAEAIANLEADAKKGFGGWWAKFVYRIDPSSSYEVVQEAEKRAERAKQIAKEIYDLEYQRMQNQVTIAQIDSDIAKYQEVMRDATYSATERSEALAKVQDLIQQKLNIQLPIEQRIADLIAENNALASSSLDDENQEIQAKVKAYNLETQAAAERRSLLKIQKQINAELAKEAEQRAEIARQAAAMSASRSALAGLDLSVSEGALATIANIGAEIEVPATLILDTDEAVEDIIDLSQEIESALNSTFASVGQAFGELVADLATGDNAWGNFAQAGLTVLGDLAQQVGKLAVGIGTAALGLEASLSNPLDPAAAIAAIAAGTALIALGAMVKKVGGNVNNYSASAGVASGSYSGSAPGSSYATQQLNVHVTGELVAKGSTLTAVLNNEKNRTNRTT